MTHRLLRSARLATCVVTCVVAMVWACLAAGTADAQASGGAGVPPAAARGTAPVDPALERQVRALSSRLRCPVCQGESIQDSPAELSNQMRDIVREQLAAGRTPAQVEEYFVARYGEWILLEPEAHGVNLLVYLLPPLALLVGGVVVVVAVRRWTGNPARPVDAPQG